MLTPTSWHAEAQSVMLVFFMARKLFVLWNRNVESLPASTKKEVGCSLGGTHLAFRTVTLYLI